MQVKNWKPRVFNKISPRTIISMSDREYMVMNNGAWVRIDRRRGLIGRRLVRRAV